MNYAGYTKLLCHFNGTDGQTTYVSDDVNRRVATFYGTGQLSTTENKFGTASFKGDGVASYVSFPASADWSMGYQDFTIDFWMNPSADDAGAMISGFQENLDTWYFQLIGNLATCQLDFFMQGGAAPAPNEAKDSYSTVLSLTAGVWYHVAAVMKSSVLKLYLDGIDVTDTAAPAQVVRIYPGTFVLNVGSFPRTGSSDTYFNGYLDEVRITVGAARWVCNFTPPVIADSPDSSVLLCHFNGADASTNHGTATINGAATMSSVKKKFGVASYYGDGNTADYITFPASSDWNFGTADFTVDCWVYMLDWLGPYATNWVWGNGATYYENAALGLYYNGGGSYLLFNKGGVGNTDVAAGPEGDFLNGWHHIAVVRSGNTITLYQDGIAGTPKDVTGVTLGIAADVFSIGYGAHAAVYLYYGYIDEFRVSKGIARWTHEFVPPRAPYRSDANTSLLLHFNTPNGLTTIRDEHGGDSSSYENLPTYIGTAQLDTVQSKFGGGSLLLNGSSDSVSFPDSSIYNFKGEDWTVDCWIRLNSTSGQNAIIGKYGDAPSGYSWYLIISSGTLWQAGYSTTGSDFTTTNFTDSGISANIWYHIAWVRKGQTLQLFKDGVLVGGYAIGADNVYNNSAVSLKIGDLSQTAAHYWFNGWIEELRISNGVARWDAAYTLPTSEYVVDGSTTLLCHFNGADGQQTYTSDDVGARVATFGSTAQLKTAQKKFGATSLWFDGNSDYIEFPASGDWALGTNDFTIDFWVMLTAYPGAGARAGVVTNGGSYWYLSLYEESGLYYWSLYDGQVGPVIDSLTYISLNTWHHVALTRSGNVWSWYQDGIRLGSSVTATNNLMDGGNALRLGSITTSYLSGYLDELRISTGVVRWAMSGFTPPQRAFGGIGTKTQSVIIS